MELQGMPVYACQLRYKNWWCTDSDFIDPGSNPVLQILNPNLLRIQHQHYISNPTPSDTV